MRGGEQLGPDARFALRESVCAYVLKCAEDVLSALEERDLAAMAPVNLVRRVQVLEYQRKAREAGPAAVLTPDIASAICELWKDLGAIERVSQFRLRDNAGYFFEHASRMAASGYTPTDGDILKSPTKNTGMRESSFHLGPSLRVVAFEINESQWTGLRKKLSQVFEDMTSIIYCTALSDYDAVLYAENKMKRSIDLFESIINSRFFARTAVLLAFTKLDVFTAKLSKVPLEAICPDYEDGPDVAAATKFIQQAFLRCNRARLSVYPVVTQATDPTSTDSFRKTNDMFQDTLLRNALKEANIVD
ncbi:G-alpha-domain-containing protein [Artomyces pyxidatus]|uniref:G-alpha-domain-containing protein n=1 Tax=Artomyces pyxidatus TaxID=48021 RepID=A0ACB8T5S4_9AGAM|nr:G-alpha-domain-containing protein [Artomyces pyxidatus]